MFFSVVNPYPILGAFRDFHENSENHENHCFPIFDTFRDLLKTVKTDTFSEKTRV